MRLRFALLILPAGAWMFSGCETLSLGDRSTTAPPPSAYETAAPPLQPAADSPAPVAASSGAAPGSPRPFRPVRSRVVEHTVVKGDSLWSLAQAYESTIDEIREANQITGDVIKTGQKLQIPTSMPETPLPTSSPEVAAPGAPPLTPPPFPRSVSGAPSTPSWTVTPPVTPPTSSPSSAPQYRIPEPVILPPPGEF